jgi:hypothetical protein
VQKSRSAFKFNESKSGANCIVGRGGGVGGGEGGEGGVRGGGVSRSQPSINKFSIRIYSTLLQ